MNKFIKNKSNKAKKDHFSLNRSDSFKKHFRQRLKDRHKIRGYCFSYTKDKIITSKKRKPTEIICQQLKWKKI